MANLHVNLAFSADTGKAKAQIQELQTLLSKIAYTGSTSNNITGTMQKDLQQASTAAKELQFHLNNAFNTTTGKFDLSLLDKSLKTSGTNISNLSTQLLGAGATGQQAFMKLAQSISLADQPMLRISKRMQEFAVTMKNTVKWQLSSSMLHGFMGAIQSAYGYAQDLNKSLTDIRIVTGYSTDQMAQFAEQANKAAKALSTTTTDYTNASLIYFQQGLSDQEVAARTDITVKMANAAGQSAQVVSDQMTAVWNNFYDGSKSLEYYADVMTALGAATASSTDEISEGLSKFAAVADTVGLSYEFATAALTTITSNTRESADVVGNALKTLFARIQGLQLGETLEDGTDLNKYSQALEKVGISIYEQNGSLKEMDNILVEMAAKWDTLSNTQQVALAQTVAGVRQYTQLVAVMENWDNGDADSFMANLRTIEGAEGTLDEQAEIYAQSWEAAQKRVQTAAEGIYQSLLDDDFFISINNGFANLLGGLDAFIDGAGGVKTVLAGIASIALSAFAHQIPDALDTFKYNLEVVTKGSQSAYDRIQEQMSEATKTAFNEYITSNGEKGIKEDSSAGYAIKQANELTAARNKLALVSDKMSASEKQMANVSLSLIQQQQEEVVALKQKNEALQESINLQTQSLQNTKVNKTVSTESSSSLAQMRRSYHVQQDVATEEFEALNEKDINQLTEKDLDKIGALDDMKTQYQLLTAEIDSFYESYSQVIDNIQSSSQTLGENLLQKWLNPETATAETVEFSESFKQSLESIQSLLTNTEIDDALKFDTAIEEMKALQNTIPQVVQEVTGLDRAFDKVINSADITEFSINFEKILEPALKDCKIEIKDFQTILETLYGKSKIQQLSNDTATLAIKEKEAAEKAKILEQNLANFNPGHITRLSEAFSGLVGFLGSTVTAVNTVKSIFSNLGNPDLSGWEKFSSFITGLTVLVPTVSSAFSGLSTAVSGATQWLATQNLLVGASTGAFGAQANSINKATMAEISNYIATAKANGELEEKIIASVAAKLMTKGLAEADAEAAAAAIVHAGGVEFLNGFLVKLGGLLTWIKGHLLLTIGIAAAVVAAIAGIVWVIDQLHTSQKEANEAISEANNKYAEEQQKLDELEESLKSVQDRITELQSQDSLSLVEQEELDKLLEQEASLQRQVALQQQLTQVAKQNFASTFEDNAEKASSWMNTAPTSEQWATVYDPSQEMHVDKYYNSIEDFKADIDRMYLDANGQVLEGQKALYQQYMDQYNTWVNEYNQAQAQWIEANKDSLLELTEGYQNWFDLYGNNPQYADQMMQYAKLISDANKVIYGDSYNEKVLGSMDNTFEASTDTKDKNVTNTIIKGLSDGTGAVETFATDVAAGFSDSFKNSLLKQGILPEDYAQHLIDEYSRIASALEGTGITLEDLIADGMSLEDLEILAQIKITGEDDLNSILQKIEAYKSNDIEVGFNLDQWKKDYSSKMNAIDEIDEYGFIDAENYALLSDEYSEYFEVQSDGTAILKMRAEEFRAIVEGIELDKLKTNIGDLKSQSKTGAEAYGNIVGRDNVTEEYVTNMANQMQASANQGNAETWIGTNAEKGLIAATDFNQTLDDFATAEEYIIALTNAWLNLQNTLDNSQGTLASTANSINELDEMLNEGIIDIEEYNNAFDGTIAREAKLHDLDYDSILDFARYLKTTNKELAENEQLCKKIALSYHRWDKGVKTIAENFEEWTDNIKNANKNSVKYINTINDMKDAYKDVFSEVDPNIIEQLSDEFLTSKDNLRLLEQGLAGNEQAWNDWEANVLQEINRINPAFANVSAEMKAQMNELVIAAANLDFSGLTPGASIDDTDFNAKLSAMVFNTAEAAQAMCDNLSAVGVDAEIEEHTGTTPPESFTTTQTGSFTVTPPDGPPQVYGINSSYVETVEGKEYKWYTLKGAKYNGKGVTAGGGGYNKPSSGGGGGSSKKEPKHAEKKSSSEKTRYHTLQNQLEDLTAEYDAISDAADRAFGQDKLDAIDDEIAKTDELIAKQEEYIQAIQSDLPVDKAVMTAYYDDVIGGPAIQFDENGNIANYDEIQDAMFNKYNQMTSLDEDSEEWQVFEKKYEQLEKYIEQYEETYDLLREEEAAYQDLLNQRIDLELEKVQYKVEIELAVPEDEIAVIEYQLGRIEDDAFKTAEAIDLLTREAEAVYDQIEINKQGLNEALKLSLSVAEINELMAGNMDVLNGKNFTADQIDAIREYRDNLLSLNEEFDDIRESVEEQVIEAFDAWHEKLEDGIDKFDHYGSILESYQNIIDIVGKDVLGVSDAVIGDLAQANVENAINQVEATKDAYEALQQAQLDAEEELEKAKARGDEQSIQFWTDTLNEIQIQAEDAQEEMMNAWEEALDRITEQFEAAVQTAVDAFNEAVYQLGGIEALSNEFDRQQEMADMYLDDYQKIYELSKLNRDINNSIDDTDSLAGKQKLKKLLGEINELQADGVEMSQYDLEYLQAEYDLRLAEIALEEAQRAKDVVRLQKDNEGNWSYVYTQNTDAVDEAQQKYEDALYAMQDLSSNYIDEMSQQLIDTSQEMQEALAAIRVEDYASIEEYYEEVERIQEQYKEEIAMQEAELQKAVDNNKELYDTDWTNYHNATGYKISDTEEFVTKFSDSLLGTLMNSESATVDFGTILGEATDNLVNELYLAAENYYTNLANIMAAAGTSTDGFAEDLAENVDQIKADSEEAAIAIEDMATRMQEQMDNVINKVAEWQQTYGEAMQEIINANLAVIESFNEMIATLSMDDSTVTVTYDIQNANQDVQDASQFDTGGYTGTWGNTGKLAVLHEKELILNSGDTSNMLKAMQISKLILDTIELNAQQASYGMGALTATTVKDEAKQILEQTVQITAEFPDATDHNEIKEAFNSLINYSSQYANRK